MRINTNKRLQRAAGLGHGARPGLTLLEVLVAIFVMGIGLLSLLVLFPVGALSMAQAIKDARCGQCAADATAIANTLKIREDTMVASGFTSAPPKNPPDPALLALNITNYPGYDGPSYPVFVDPYQTPISSSIPDSSAGVAGPWIPRLSPTSPSMGGAVPMSASLPETLRWCCLLDDIGFDDNGLPLAVTGPGSVTRQDQYSWAYMLRRPRYSDPSIVEVAVVVFSGRTPSSLTTPSGILTEHAFSGVVFTPGTNTVTITYTGEKPPVRVGGWVLDATLQTGAKNSLGNVLPEPYGFFYRVVGITEGAGTITLELQTPIRQSSSTSTTAAHTGTLVIMENVAEVFEVGAGWQP